MVARLIQVSEDDYCTNTSCTTSHGSDYQCENKIEIHPMSEHAQKYVTMSSKNNRDSRLASRRNGGAVNVVGSTDTKTTAGECLPESALVGTTVSVDISLDPGVTTSGEGGVARLNSKGVDEEVEEDSVTGGAPEKRGLVSMHQNEGIIFDSYVGSVLALAEKP